MIACGHAGDYLPLLAARGQESQDGWPDVKHRRVLRRLSLSLLLFLKCRWQFLLRLEALFFIITSVCSAGSCQVLFLCLSRSSSLGAFFAVLRVELRRLLGLGSVVPVKILFSGSVFCGIAGGAAPSAGSGVRCARRLLQLVQSLLVLRLRCLLELVVRLVCLACLVLCSGRWISSSGCRCRSASGGFNWRDVSQVAVPFACDLFSSAGKFYRSFSVFRGYGPGFLPPTSGRSFIGGASAWFCLLLRLTAISLACGLAFAVFRGGGRFPRGY